MNYELLFKLEIRTNQELSRKVVELKQALSSALIMNNKVIDLLKRLEGRVDELEAQVEVKDKEIERIRQEGKQIRLPTMETYKYI